MSAPLRDVVLGRLVYSLISLDNMDPSAAPAEAEKMLDRLQKERDAKAADPKGICVRCGSPDK